jgi:transposase
MTPREERGLIIAATCRLNRKPDGTWIVPSQTSKVAIFYTVDLESKKCTCPDCTEGGFVCKHYFAASIVHKRDVLPDGTVIETKTMTLTARKTYKQDWRAYNLAQSTEKHRFQQLLFDLTRGIPELPLAATGGQRPHTTKDSLFAMAFKVYSTVSARRFSCDLKDAHERGHTAKLMPGLKVCHFFENPTFTPILKTLIAQSAQPLRTVETKFAIDSSGFSSSKFFRWYDEKYGITRQKCEWVKVHLACGVKTNIVTAVRILDRHAADSPQFLPLVKENKRGFEISEVSADKAYASLENFEEIAAMGAQAYIAFKSNTTGGVGGAFEKAFHYFQFKNEEYMEHYHLRSNVESTFSAIKRKFGDSVRSKCEYAMVNETLCKILCHNICCLIQEQCELGIEPVFWQNEERQPNAGPALLQATAG